MTGQELEGMRKVLAKRHLFFTMNDSKERREALLQYLLEHGRISVNRKYCIIVKKDKDLQKLLKSEKIEQFKDHWAHWSSHSYVRLTEKGRLYAEKAKERTKAS